MRQNKLYLVSLVGFLGLVFIVGACSGGVETARQSKSNLVNKDAQKGAPVPVDVEPDSERDLKRHPSGHVVKPGKCHVSPGQRIVWTNKTGGMMLIQIPDDRIFGHPLTALVDDGDKYTSPKVAEHASPGEYEYTVFMYKNHKHADAESNPGIIIP
jgi:hypothetical protein